MRALAKQFSVGWVELLRDPTPCSRAVWSVMLGLVKNSTQPTSAGEVIE
jgi:hypothetical protein